jgi:replication initiation protein RepC
MDTHQEAYKHAYRKRPSGLRRLTPPMLETLKTAERFAGVDDTTPGQVLAAFKSAAPYLGIRPGLVHAIDWLFRFTQVGDWRPGMRPIVWPSAAMQRQDLCLGISQVKNLNRQLVEHGLVVMKDSPNGKRYGIRNLKGQIIEAYGFDLSPLAERLIEFQGIAEEGRAIRLRVQGLRRRATIARNGLRQIIEAAQEQVLSAFEVITWQDAAASVSRGIAAIGDADQMEFAVARLERLQHEARACFEKLLLERRSALNYPSEPVNNDPTRPLNQPHITTTKQPFYPKDTVFAHKRSSFGQATDPLDLVGASQYRNSGFEPGVEKFKQGKGRAAAERTDNGTIMKTTPDELVRLAPRLIPYLARLSPDWPEIVDAADFLRYDLKISTPLWGDACQILGRNMAAIAVAIVSSKPEDHFRTTPAGYFHGMISRAKMGELRLDKTIWGMRGASNPGTSRPSSEKRRGDDRANR